MTTLDKMPTRELCDSLRELATAITEKRGTYPEDSETVMQAARRLSRYAPVKIDPEDEGTWPTEADADSRGRVSVWDESTKRWWECGWDRAAYDPDNTHWRRINNEPPEGG